MGNIKLNWQMWLYGFFAALVGGGAGAVTAAFGAMLLTPGQYGTGGVAGWNSLKLMGITFLVSGVFSAFAYLSRSPLPPVDTTATVTTTATVSTTVNGPKS